MPQLKYDHKAIQHLEGIDAIRKRPGMYIGSVGPEGVLHITKEIISNAIDEYLAGYCTEIVVIVKDDVITIMDNGRGIPVGKMENGMNTLEGVFTLLHTGAKFNSDGSTGYNSSGGMNGVGAKATNALSEFFKAIVYRDGKKHTMIFNRGKKVSYTVENSEDTKRTGTVIQFKPDIDIFTSIKLDINQLNKMLMELSFLCKGLEITLISDTLKRKYKSENGILDYIKTLNKQTAITDIFYTSHIEGNIGIEVGMVYNDSYTETIKLYTNNIPNTGGTHLTGFKTTFTRKINEYARNNKLLKDKDENLTGDDLREGMVLVVSLKMPDPVFNGQTKDILTSAEGRTIVERFVAEELEHWFNSSPESVKTIINKALLARRAKEAARKAREVVRKKTGGYSTILPSKLADCTSNNSEECELYLVEGDSAGGSAKQARDRKTQAILPLRGKIINTLKNEKILDNTEIKDLVSAIGVGVGENIDLNKLRYNKIVIMTDADVDGAHIRTLLLTFFYLHMTPLVEEGHIYIAMPPLYRIIKGKESFYVLDDAELALYKKKYGDNLIVQRFKGLGEMNPQQLKETTMGPNRRLKQVTVEDAEKACEILAILMGDDVASRKEFIENNAYRAEIDI